MHDNRIFVISDKPSFPQSTICSLKNLLIEHNLNHLSNPKAQLSLKPSNWAMFCITMSSYFYFDIIQLVYGTNKSSFRKNFGIKIWTKINYTRLLVQLSSPMHIMQILDLVYFKCLISKIGYHIMIFDMKFILKREPLELSEYWAISKCLASTLRGSRN